MAKQKFLDDKGLETLVSNVKTYVNNAIEDIKVDGLTASSDSDTVRLQAEKSAFEMTNGNIVFNISSKNAFTFFAEPTGDSFKISFKDSSDGRSKVIEHISVSSSEYTPTINGDLTTKKYVDSAIASGGGSPYIINGTGTNAIVQKTDPKYTVVDVKSKNPNAYALDNSLDNTDIGAEGQYSSSFGGNTAALGKRAMAQGTSTVAKGAYSHAEGDNCVTLAADSHAEGYANTTSAEANASHAEGNSTITKGEGSHTEGRLTITNANYSHAEGHQSNTLKEKPTSSGGSGSGSTPTVSEPDKYLGWYSHAEGESCNTLGYASHAEGEQTSANGHYSHAEGLFTTAGLVDSTTKKASGTAAHAEGYKTYARGDYSHAEGQVTTAIGTNSHAEGINTTASGNMSHAEGSDTKATDSNSHSEGFGSQANGPFSHAEGYYTVASGQGAHTEGYKTATSADYAKAVGLETKASGYGSLAAGYLTEAKHYASMAIGGGTKTAKDYQFVSGMFNEESPNSLFVVGNGTSDTKRSNALDVRENGDVYITGNLYCGADFPQVLTTDSDEIRMFRHVIGIVSNNAGISGSFEFVSKSNIVCDSVANLRTALNAGTQSGATMRLFGSTQKYESCTLEITSSSCKLYKYDRSTDLATSADVTACVDAVFNA